MEFVGIVGTDMGTVDFNSALDSCTNPEIKAEHDKRFGEDGNVIAIVGTGFLNGIDIAVARMITNGDIVPFTEHIFVSRDGDSIVFMSGNLLLLAAKWDNHVEKFMDVAEINGFFVFEAITPNKVHKALTALDGKVKNTFHSDITQTEYEKHLAGFYCNKLPNTGIKAGQS